uniref:Protein SCAI n=1 Tax=Salix viminalis TaxID=40686 RepID=A0A6N2LCD6_SALVM
MYLDAVSTSPFSSSSNSPNPSSRQSKSDCLHFGTRGNGGLNSIYPTDLIPFTRRPLFIVIDSDSSEAFKAISGAEKGEPAAIILSPSCSIPLTTADSSRHHSGSLLTMFLTAPLQAFCLLIGLSGPDVEMDTYNKAEKLLSSSLNAWGLTLATSDILDPVWAQILGDPFLRRLLLRFLFCRAVLALLHHPLGRRNFILSVCHLF